MDVADLTAWAVSSSFGAMSIAVPGMGERSMATPAAVARTGDDDSGR
jgi:hypothetical protein